MKNKQGRLPKRLHDVLVTVIILLVATGVSFAVKNIFDTTEQVTDIFTFAVFLIALWTEGYFYGLAAAVVGMLAVNYAFTFPFFFLNFTIHRNALSAVIMLSIAISTSTLTSKLKIQEALRAENEREHVRANLLRAVSHDLRTPLTTICGASSTLLESRESLTDEQQDMILRGIHEDSNWLMRMVENLLSITRLDGGRIKIAKTPTVLDELIDSVMVKFGKRYPNRQVSLDIPGEIVVIPMDALLIEQVILNILENAVLHAVGMNILSLKIFTLGNRAVFEISDDGCGMDAERLKSIFTGGHEHKAESADSRKRNAGIGLSVCATIIRAHGGDISAESRVGEGTVFRFALNTEESADDEQ